MYTKSFKTSAKYGPVHACEEFTQGLGKKIPRRDRSNSTLHSERTRNIATSQSGTSHDSWAIAYNAQKDSTLLVENN